MEAVLYIGALVITTIANVFLNRGRPPALPSPSIAHIEARRHAEEACERAEQAACEALELVRKIQREAEAERERARARQEEAERAAARAMEDMRRIMVEMETAKRAARMAQETAEAAAKSAKEELQKLRQEAREERKRMRRMQDETEKAMRAAKVDAERAKREADEERRKADAGRARAEEAVRMATEERRRALEAKDEAERRLKEGLQPVVTPSPTELAAAKERVQYREDYFHFAIAGVSGSGKSSLVNAFRGLRSEEDGAAAVGVTETTLEMTRYPEANPDIPFVWYDVPGAGTFKCRDWQYFNDQGLYVFDCIIVLFDNRFTMTDIAILANARRFHIPTYIVRSKADQHIRNVMIDMGYDSDNEESYGRRNELYKAAHLKFIEETRNTVKTNLGDANLPDQRVYVVSNIALLDIMKRKKPKRLIDEVELLDDLYSQAHRRRGGPSNEVP